MALTDSLARAAGQGLDFGRRARQWLSLRRYLPRGLFGRSLMILMTPVLIMQGVAIFYFYDRHWETITKRLALGVAGEIAMIIDEFRRQPNPRLRAELFERAEATLSLTLGFRPRDHLRQRMFNYGNYILRVQLIEALSEEVHWPVLVAPQVLGRWAEIQVQLPEGVLTVLVPRRRLFSVTSQVFMVYLIGSGLVLFPVALLFMRNQVRAIRRLAEAADSFGKGRDVPHFRPAGATEVRRAARAFMVMRDRLQRQITQRTEMLAGVSHDLRTPLTRMKLELALLGDGPEVAGLQADLVEMERMIEGYLAFARGEGAEEPAATDLVALLDEVVAAARRNGAQIEQTVAATPPMRVTLRPQAIRRCLTNLLSNAQRHARHIWVQAEWRAGQARVLIDDDGPGIPEDRMEDVFRPFQRLDSSRNPATGGSGLGLTIARDVARAHGGDVTLARSPQGGLRCIVGLPV